MNALVALLLACGPEPGPGEYEDGVYHCCAEGDGTACCEGLEFLEPMEESEEDCGESYPEGCCPSATPSLFYCAACGDGDCAAGENACNCPGDCA